MLEPYDLQPHARMPYRLYRKAQVFRHDDNGYGIRLDEPLTSYAGAETFENATVIVKDPEFIHHYFHFMEILLALWAFDKTFLPKTGIRRIVFTTPNWTNPAQNHIQREILAAAYPDVRVDAPLTFRPEVIDNVVLIDRTLAVTDINKFLEPVQWIAGLQTGAFVDAISRRAMATPRSPATAMAEGLRALYLRRPLPRRLSGSVEERLLAMLRTLGLQVDVIDYAQLPWNEQIRATAGYDVLIGMHGNGLSNLLWLPPHAGVLKFFSPGAHHYDYQLLAELKRLAYFGLEGRSDGSVYREFSRDGPAIGHGWDNNMEVTNLPWLAVAQFVAVLQARVAMAAPLGLPHADKG